MVAPKLGSCASSRRAWRLWAAWHFQEEDVPLPLPPLLEPAASEAAHFTACRPDKSVTCKDCSTPFVFTGREQDFFEEKGWGGAARVRCHECSKAKKAGYAERAEAGERAGEATTKRKATADEAQPLPEDKTVKCLADQACKTCVGDFIFTGKEQRFFAQKGFPERSRCAACTAAKKKAPQAEGH